MSMHILGLLFMHFPDTLWVSHACRPEQGRGPEVVPVLQVGVGVPEQEVDDVGVAVVGCAAQGSVASIVSTLIKHSDII